MRRISRRRRYALASLSPPGILESAKCRGRGGRRDREPRRRRNPQGGRGRPSAPRKAARGRDEQRPDGRVVPLSDGAPDIPKQTMPTSIDFNTIDKSDQIHTAHHWIVDAKGHRVKLAGVNWYGADNLEFSVGGLSPAGRHRARGEGRG